MGRGHKQTSWEMSRIVQEINFYGAAKLCKKEGSLACKQLSYAEVHRERRTRGHEQEERRHHCSKEQSADEVIPWGQTGCNHLTFVVILTVSKNYWQF
jgi:hypothetical protein